MNKDIFIAIRVSVFTLLLTGLLYPFLVTEVATVFFYKKARGSLIINENRGYIGSELIGQTFTSPTYFSSRPSLAGVGYDGMASGGSNDSPTSKQLLARVHAKTEALKGQNREFIPLDLVTASASGLDPHITPLAAYWQAPKIALARDVSLRRVVSIISNSIENPQFGFMGSARVNVLKLNIALDQFFGLQVPSQ